MIREIRLEDVKECAYLHYESIKDSFLCEFGVEFIQKIYRKLIKSDKCFGYVYTNNSDIIGFVTGSVNMEEFMRSLFVKDFFEIAPMVFVRLIIKPYLIKNVIQTLLYSKKSDVENVKAELVSIVVRKDQRGKKIGTLLLDNLIDRFKKTGISKFKVMVDKSNAIANDFYRNSGFKLHSTFSMYNKDINLYVYD